MNPWRVDTRGRDEEVTAPAPSLQGLGRERAEAPPSSNVSATAGARLGAGERAHLHARRGDRIQVRLEGLRIELVARRQRPREADGVAVAARGDVVVHERAHGLGPIRVKRKGSPGSSRVARRRPGIGGRWHR